MYSSSSFLSFWSFFFLCASCGFVEKQRGEKNTRHPVLAAAIVQSSPTQRPATNHAPSHAMAYARVSSRAQRQEPGRLTQRLSLEDSTIRVSVGSGKCGHPQSKGA